MDIYTGMVTKVWRQEIQCTHNSKTEVSEITITEITITLILYHGTIQIPPT